MLFEIHMLKNYPATNLNRDDTGSPKTCVFGGVQRSRISSQCLKRSWRLSPLLKEEISENCLGIRTRKLPELVCEKLRSEGISEDYLEEAKKHLTGFANKESKENDKGITSQVIIYSKEDIEAVTNVVKELTNTKSVNDFKKIKAKEMEALLKDAKARPVSVDIALFGRMVTSDAFADVDASMQVAHAFSVNKAIMESDFFTAMDDLIDGKEDTGSGMMGDTDYTSSCYYIYASLDTDALRKNLENSEEPDKIVEKVVPALVKTMAFANPSGKQNTFAGNVLPSAVLIECKDYPVPVSYANAFVKPVRATYENDLVEESVKRLAEHVNRIDEDFGLPLAKRYWFCAGLENKIELPEKKDNLVINCKNFADMINAVSDFVKAKK